MITHLTPMLETHDVAGTVSFYVDVFGFTCDNYIADAGWAHVSKDNAKIMFSKPGDHRPFVGPAMTGSIYLIVDNVDDVWNDVKTRCKVWYEPETFDYGMREFGVSDNNGYLIQFGQEVSAR